MSPGLHMDPPRAPSLWVPRFPERAARSFTRYRLSMTSGPRLVFAAARCVHGFCVAGGTDVEPCSDLLVIADDAKVGYPPARVGLPDHVPVGAPVRAREGEAPPVHGRLPVREGQEWGLAIESAPPKQLDERFEMASRPDRALADRSARHDETAP